MAEESQTPGRDRLATVHKHKCSQAQKCQKHKPKYDISTIIKLSITQQAVLLTACKRRADDECDAKPAKIIRSELNCSGYEGESFTLQDVANMRQSIYRSRRKKYPALPKSQEESIEKLRSIPLSTNRKEDFLLYAEMTEIGPIAIFTCITNLEHLTNAEFLLADGTFSVTPKQ